jgi:hypothetical protein
MAIHFGVIRILTTLSLSRSHTKRIPQTGKAALRSTMSVNTNQEWMCGQVIDISHNTETPATKSTPDTYKHNVNDSMASC